VIDFPDCKLLRVNGLIVAACSAEAFGNAYAPLNS
jgi:hypothetical protein